MLKWSFTFILPLCTPFLFNGCSFPFVCPLPPNSSPSLNIRKSDVLTIFDGGDLTARILGQYLGPHPRFSLYSSGPVVTLQFQSDPGDPLFGLSQGFLVRYKGRKKNSASEGRTWEGPG